jgi:CRP/FNR family transcriptional regulator
MTTATLEVPARATRTIPARTIPVRAVSSPQAGAQPPTRCTSCHLRDLCLPCGLSELDMGRLDALMFARRRIKAGEVLYHEGQAFASIYAVRSGTFRSTVMLADGREQVTNFHIGGELMGLDGAAQGNHASTATALEDAEICAIPYRHLCDLTQASPGMQQLLTRLMSRELVREHSLMLLLGSMNSEERLATFLLNFSRRLKARGYSASEFHLRMSRADIGSYLGLTLETVSRTFSSFQQHGLLDVDKRHIRILDMERLAGSFETRLH